MRKGYKHSPETKANIGVGAYETDGESPYTPADKQAVSIRALLTALPDGGKK